MKYKIYSLVCPIDGKVKYVGVTSFDLQKRLVEHCRQQTGCNKSNWIKSLKAKGLIPIINLLEECDKKHLKVERKWINFHLETIINPQQGRPKTKPDTTIFPIRYEKAKLIEMKKFHGAKIHAYLKGELDKIYSTNKVPKINNEYG